MKQYIRPIASFLSILVVIGTYRLIAGKSIPVDVLTVVVCVYTMLDVAYIKCKLE